MNFYLHLYRHTTWKYQKQRKLNHKMKKKTALKIVYESYNVYVYLIKVKVVFIVITINAYIILNCVTAK